MFVLGIDPGLSRTGYGVIEASGSVMRPVAAGAINTEPGMAVGDRLVELHRDLTELVVEYQPAEAAIEAVFVNKNLQTATTVGRASGIAYLVLAAAGVPVAEYSPTAVKMAVAGYGNADKNQVQRLVAMRLGLPEAPKPADAADALAIAMCHVQSRTLKAVGR
ncbi:MAG: crossover junction endodeoxyribonuclease RuvC [Acidimicrobiia bacterium]|nr:crossover junction endodeoxyribonuclease RuvC [Acidimicrobiia bacterium]NNF69223.1 crossover junction endodeoxyribonuclease RuvC [Acidimicrobiia bacterium]NNK91946.1 crossover junction endodeoxyribonuclease RuvC [Acidimicrobiia bacterium]